MATRNPPSRSSSTRPISIYAFEKNTGTVASTFVGRIISRTPIHLQLRTGGFIRAVRFDGRFWPIYPPETFEAKSREWIKDGDRVYGNDHSDLKLPLEHPYLFDCDQPRGSYD